MYRLNCSVQNYAWGRPSSESEVAQLSLAAGRVVDTTKPFAELWMGTHPSAPSVLADNGLAGTDLKRLLQERPAMLGAATFEFGIDLPFLFKVLSVNTALSIQSHPDKELAKQLHAANPEIYKDDNHKPEMALALTEFEALCEFVDHDQLVEAFQTVPELRECTNDVLADAYIQSSAADRKQALQQAFSALMVCDETVVAVAVDKMARRLQQESEQRELSVKEKLVVRLNDQYPQDVGVLAAWFLNYIRLQPGQAICLAANEPHAYVSGEIIEVMATSDNVIRAGLTPKTRDVEVLCNSLTYSQGAPDLLYGEKVLPYLLCYRPPSEFREFELYSFKPPADSLFKLPACLGPLMMLVQHGSCTVKANWDQGKASQRSTQRGDVWFVAAGTRLEFQAEEDMVVWFAACNGLGFAPLVNNVLPFVSAAAVAQS